MIEFQPCSSWRRRRWTSSAALMISVTRTSVGSVWLVSGDISFLGHGNDNLGLGASWVDCQTLRGKVADHLLNESLNTHYSIHFDLFQYPWYIVHRSATVRYWLVVVSKDPGKCLLLLLIELHPTRCLGEGSIHRHGLFIRFNCAP